MAWIEVVKPEEAEGTVAEVYEESLRRAGHVAHVVRLSSLNPPVLRAWIDLYKAIMLGPSPLSRAEREMVATVVSWENRCHY